MTTNTVNITSETSTFTTTFTTYIEHEFNYLNFYITSLVLEMNCHIKK